LILEISKYEHLVHLFIIGFESYKKLAALVHQVLGPRGVAIVERNDYSGIVGVHVSL
jgi:hypothetical protein